MRGVRQKLSRPAVVLSGLALALSTLCAPAARAGLFDDEEARKAIIDLRTRFDAELYIPGAPEYVIPLLKGSITFAQRITVLP